MNILVTGGAGFIGSHIAEAYCAAGHSVLIIDNLSTGFASNLPAAATFARMDIRDPGLPSLLAQHRIEIINHHAAQIDVRASVADPGNDLAINVLGTLNLLEAAIRSGIRRFIFASSGGAVYGEQEYFPADERHPTAPCSPYGITKLCVEKYLFYYRTVHGLSYTAFRYTNVYGPRQSPHGEAGVVAIFCDKLLAGGHPVINGDGLQTRDYVFVEDVVRANLAALGMEGTETLNVCTGRETTVNEIFGQLNRICGTRAPEQHGAAKAGEQLRSVCTYEKIRALLGWSPRVGIEEGLERTADFFKSRD